MAIPASEINSALAKDITFQGRINFFMHKAATDVIGEGSPTANRHDYSVSVLEGSANIFEMTMAVLTNATVSASVDRSMDGDGVTDSDMEFTVNSMWDDFSSKMGDVV